MKLFITSSFLYIILWTSFSLCNVIPDESINEIFEEPVTEKSNKLSGEFETNLYMEMVKNNDKNIIFSPLSIKTALSLVMFGATGETRQEIKHGMGVHDLSDEEIQHNYKKLSKHIKADPGVKIANKIYVAQKQSIKLSFNEIAKSTFESEAQSIDFVKSQETADVINKWVENQTNNKIKDLISPAALGADTRMVLVNAIYFKGEWKKKFEVKRTSKKDFYLNNEKNVKVDMMQMEVNIFLFNFI